MAAMVFVIQKVFELPLFYIFETLSGTIHTHQIIKGYPLKHIYFANRRSQVKVSSPDV